MAKYELTMGVQRKAAKAVFYGPEGIGKSTLAAQMPSPVFIDIEGGTNQLPVARMPRPTSWTMLLDEVRAVRDGEVACETVVIDTVDSAESLCRAHVCAENTWPSIETPGYGKGFTSLTEEFSKLLDLLSETVERGTNAVLLGHSIVANVTRPDESAYTAFSLNLVDRRNASNCAMVKAWADMVLFLDYKVYVSIGKDGKGHAEGGGRVVRTEHSATWDAKNRFRLPPEIPLDSAAEQILPLMAGGPGGGAGAREAPGKAGAGQIARDAVQETPAAPETGLGEAAPYARPDYPERLKALADLMEADRVTDEELRRVVSKRGTYPESCRVEDYEQDFCDFMVAKWDGLLSKIKESREIPF